MTSLNGMDTINLRKQVISAALNVFDTMLALKIELSSEAGVERLFGNRVVGSIGFAGEVMGNVSLQVSEQFSRIITASMLGRYSGAPVATEEIKDVIGELSSMIGGCLKSRICDTGIACELSFPSVTTGEDFRIEHMSWERHEQFVFSCHDHFMVIDVRIKTLVNAPEEVTMIDEEEKTFIDIEKFVTTAAEEVFDMMLSMEIVPCPIEETGKENEERIVGAVSFAGDVTGNVSVQVSRSFGELITANMLGMDIEELEGDDEVNDAVGELSNMIGGNLKSRFCDTGFPCELSIPSVTTGSDFKIENLGWTRHEQYAFKHQQYTTLVEVCMKLEK